MNLRSFKTVFLSCLTLFVLGCHKDKVEDITGGSGEESCGISLRLKTDMTLNVVALTRAGETPADEEFGVRIENTKGEVLRTWKYNDVPSLIKVVPGAYKLVGWYGADTVLPAFTAPYYYGETKITLKEGDNLDTVVNCSLAAVKVAVGFDESFGYEYAEYSVDVKTVGDSLRFEKEEGRAAYFKPGNLRLRFLLRPFGSEMWYEFYPPAIGTVKAKQFYKMKLKANTDKGALKSITVTTDSTTIDIPVDVELPPFYLPKAAPKVTPQGFVSGDVVETTEGLSKKATVLVTSAGGLTELKVKTVSDTLIARGWPAEIDLMNATAEQLAVLKNNGLEWSDVLTQQDTVKTTVFVRFDNVVKLLNTAPGNTAASAFEVVVKDRFNQTGDAECKLNVSVAPPVFGFVLIPGIGNAYAKKVEYDVNYISEVRKPVVEYLLPDGKWQKTETNIVPVEGDHYECTGCGLVPETAYRFRVSLGQHVLDGGSYTTEAALQVPNANMDAWWLEVKSNWLSQKTYLYRTYNQGESSPWWSNNNLRSTWWVVAPVEANSCPAVCYVSGDKARSGKAAELRSVASGSGYANTSSVLYDESKIPGMLLIGDYNYDKPNESINYGRSFVSRPSQLSFWYHYTPYETDEFDAYIEVQNRAGGETTVLGHGTFRLQRAVADEAYQQAKADVTYTNKSLLATHMYIRFRSSTASQPNVAKNVAVDLEGIKNGWKAHVGSRLRVDDIELVY